MRFTGSRMQLSKTSAVRQNRQDTTQVHSSKVSATWNVADTFPLKRALSKMKLVTPTQATRNAQLRIWRGRDWTWETDPREMACARKWPLWRPGGIATAEFAALERVREARRCRMSAMPDWARLTRDVMDSELCSTLFRGGVVGLSWPGEACRSASMDRTFLCWEAGEAGEGE